MNSGIVLSYGPIFTIRSLGSIAWCEVTNRDDVSPEEGARCAATIQEVLTVQVLAPQSPYRGLVIDVRQGPTAVGPKTRATLERIFVAATTSQRRVAVLVGSSATQRMQFGNLCREHAREYGQVFQTEASAREWLDLKQ